MPAAAAGLIVEDDDPWSRLQVVAAISPEAGFLGLATAGIELELLSNLVFKDFIKPHSDPALLPRRHR